MENPIIEARSAKPGNGGAEFEEPMISYAQNAEDVLLRRLFPTEPTGFYIDVGAHHPLHDSVTRYFYERGWSGMNIEPIRDLFQKLSDERVRDINLNVGISNAEGEATFFESPTHSGLSTFSDVNARRHRECGVDFKERTVTLTTLARVCADHDVRDVDFLSIDVEGLEKECLEGADFNRWRPRAVVVEATHSNTRNSSHHLWEALLLSENYIFASFDGLNRYYVRAEDASLAERLRAPANVFDNFVPYRFHAWRLELEALRHDRDVLRQRLRDIDENGRLSRVWRALRTPAHRTGG